MLIVLCGMPRSGSTLQFNITWELVERHGVGEKVKWEDGKRLLDDYDGLLNLCQSDKSYVIKSHNVNDSLLRLIGEEASIKFIYVHRDLRDVVFSMQRKFEYSFKKCLDRISESIELEKSLVKLNADLLVQDYRSLRYELVVSVQTIAQFIGVECKPDAVDAIANDLGIESAYVKSRQKKVWFEHIRRKLAIVLRKKVIFSDEQHMYHPEHVSDKMGHEGSWENELEEKDLKKLQEEFGAWMTQKGYS